MASSSSRYTSPKRRSWIWKTPVDTNGVSISGSPAPSSSTQYSQSNR